MTTIPKAIRYRIRPATPVPAARRSPTAASRGGVRVPAASRAAVQASGVRAVDRAASAATASAATARASAPNVDRVARRAPRASRSARRVLMATLPAPPASRPITPTPVSIPTASSRAVRVRKAVRVAAAIARNMPARDRAGDLPEDAAPAAVLAGGDSVVPAAADTAEATRRRRPSAPSPFPRIGRRDFMATSSPLPAWPAPCIAFRDGARARTCRTNAMT